MVCAKCGTIVMADSDLARGVRELWNTLYVMYIFDSFPLCMLVFVHLSLFFTLCVIFGNVLEVECSSYSKASQAVAEMGPQVFHTQFHVKANNPNSTMMYQRRLYTTISVEGVSAIV